MTYKQRLWGFGACFVAGWTLTLLSFSRFIALINGNPTPFVVMYTVGNFLAILSSMFLAGPMRQFKAMTKESRLVISIAYVLSMAATIVVAFINMRSEAARLVLLLLLVLVQFCCSIWYMLSYIPYGRATVKTCCRNSCAGGEG